MAGPFLAQSPILTGHPNPDPDFFKNFNPDPEFIPIPILKLHSLPLKCDTKREKML